MGSALNAADWHIMRGLPLFARLTTVLRAPRGRVRGSDVAGVVEAVGSEVTRWRPGDEVYAELGLAGGASRRTPSSTRGCSSPVPSRSRAKAVLTLPG